ncbi:MAG: hypothetical protein M0P11_10425 [Anaerolineaceae bacterium]|nr:hypothetical protein [Anaerolineaceae bacterium]
MINWADDLLTLANQPVLQVGDHGPGLVLLILLAGSRAQLRDFPFNLVEHTDYSVIRLQIAISRTSSWRIPYRSLGGTQPGSLGGPLVLP